MRSPVVQLLMIALAIGIYACSDGATVGGVGAGNNDSTIFDFPDGKKAPTTGFYFFGKVDGRFHCLQEDENGYENKVDSQRLGGCTDSTFRDRQRTRIQNNTSNKNIFQFDYYQCMLDKGGSTVEQVKTFDDVFEERSYPFIEPFDPYVGVEVIWTDQNGNIYRSLPGSGSPQQSHFQINSISRNQVDNNSYSVVEGTFVGALFNHDQSKAVFVTESEFRLRFIQIPDSVYAQL